MKGFKGFEPGMVCRGKQYAENTVFEESNAVICKSGMHFCENPFDVLDYYPLLNDDATPNEFAEVEALADTHTDDNRKFCTTKLRIGAKLDFKGFVEASVDFMLKTAKNPCKKDFSRLAASGECSRLAASGECSILAASGECSQLVASGGYSRLAASGDHSRLSTSGVCSRLAASGECSRLAASGECSRLAASGECSILAASGECSQLAASGEYSRLAASGSHSIVAGIGVKNIAKAGKGSWIVLAEWKYKDGQTVPVCVKAAQVDGEIIKPDTWYRLEDGEFKEVQL